MDILDTLKFTVSQDGLCVCLFVFSTKVQAPLLNVHPSWPDILPVADIDRTIPPFKT